jgi:hypothetical protein
MGYAQTVRLIDQACTTPPCSGPCGECPGGCWPCPTWDQIGAAAQANPGSLWLIGNEPDSPYQDNIMPATYAQLYHDLYAFLKDQDPRAQVAIGGVVQATPLRIKYLGLILDAYEALYSRRMPVDVWNTHNYVLREERGGWGAEIPPGIADDQGILYDIQDHDLLDPCNPAQDPLCVPTDPHLNRIGWKQQIADFRQFMADRGYRDRPLILSEYGILMPTMYGYGFARNTAFMLETFDWMMHTTDPSIGYPADGNRLIQAWAWYSLDEDTFQTYPAEFNLFDPNTQLITPLGQAYADYAAGLTAPDVDVALLGIRHTWPGPGATEPISLTLSADVTNRGQEPASDVLVHFERDGLPAGDVTFPSLAAGEVKRAIVVLSGLAFGQWIQVAVTVDPNGQLAECRRDNNHAATLLLVSRHQFFLPQIDRSR